MAEHSKKFELVKGYFDRGLWNEEMVRNAANRWLTEEEVIEIIFGKEVSESASL